ncbi:nicotinamide riboside kinase 1 isoform X2 [Micropterus dolomieu]|uniref:nicotinamide riboside kinase 1 isoform X2 n=1 Tax=Micropterus dolomieu TaxID=147949 RepID=UPI001E8D73C3|nr:nicotinamide riboside kinase 1 isoform X2 [Micropterus dolomieu]
MKTLVVGVGGMTNGGKSTLSRSLHEQIPNSCIIAQDSYFKDDSTVPVDTNGFKQYDVLDALHMDTMMSDVDKWRRDPASFLKQQGLNPVRTTPSVDKEVFVLIVEGFLIFNYRPLNELFDKRYFMEIPYDVCKRRRSKQGARENIFFFSVLNSAAVFDSSRVYTPPDPPGYFDGYVWPMYLKNRQKMMNMVSGIKFLDGLKPKEELLAAVCTDVSQEIESLRDGDFPPGYQERLWTFWTNV